jgi:hypothetical protein
VTGDAGGSRRTRRSAEDRARSADVRVHARFGDAEELRDLLGGKSAGDRVQHLTLTVGQRCDGLLPPDDGAADNDVPRKCSHQK